jgi:hypothetical protein
MLGHLGRALLVFAVLLAQQTALAHQYWHASKAAVSADAQKPVKSNGLCDLHDLLGTVLGVAGGAPLAPALGEFSTPRATTPGAALREALLLAPRSRGPPLIS